MALLPVPDQAHSAQIAQRLFRIRGTDIIPSANFGYTPKVELLVILWYNIIIAEPPKNK